MSHMIQVFSDENILDDNLEFRRVLQNGELETGIGSGLLMDCLTDFWNNFYASTTSGTTYKIPNLHHASQEEEWKAVARIVAFGWRRFKYLPIQLAPAFLYEALSVPSSTCSLMETFFNYISPTEKDALSEALNDFRSADMEELLTILSSHNCTIAPMEQNLLRLFEEIAHKELVQEPSFILKCWKPVLKSIGESLSDGVLDKILADLQPKARNVTKHIQFPKTMSPAESTTSHHLLRFVRELDQRELGLFLWFFTGCDLFLCKTLKVSFTDNMMTEISRRPVAHTRTCVLELATNYSTFSDFRSEFLSVLQSGIWVMDMV
ncbi:uncharacterized protein LOC115403064 [Salarias fasciatus]|uniref:uncharacterized protein LOC115403064 n=1 Tax=Salarias fasciatus TaxID=181472 RepID=UPI00117705B8|nr:uncharacterized protein LOC115403064 [Salarias fasciatus]XP_029967712.1 uncharacterized protein LOC115403064 [Salarias fasciatus]